MKTKRPPPTHKLRTLSVLLTVAVLFGVFACLPVGAEEEYEDIYHWYTTKNNIAVITGYRGESSDLIVPNTLSGCPVTEIGNYVFASSENLASVVLPDSITTIGHFAFQSCYNLESVKLPINLETIGEFVFSDCQSLKNITIPAGVTSIGEWAFWNCKDLTSIVIPNSVTKIGSSAFAGCNSLTIYCEAPSKPEGWDNKWTGWSGKPTVVWGYQPTDEPEKPDEPENPDNPENPSEPENPDEPGVPSSLGDVSGDETLNANDYMMLKRYVLHTFNLTDDQLAVADINADGDVNANDYMILKRAVLGTYKLPSA